MKHHLLRDIPDFDKKIVDKLAELWINSAEHLVSDTSSPKSLHKMAEYLHITDGDMTEYREIARSYVPKSLLKELDSGTTEKYPLGLRLEKHDTD